jgi:hypothetical protein
VSDYLSGEGGWLTGMAEVWTLYKEVQTYYAAGLDPPEDVTLIFPDDNAGNVQRLPTGNESERAGGIGVCTLSTSHCVC